jgi:hypothetical protein
MSVQLRWLLMPRRMAGLLYMVSLARCRKRHDVSTLLSSCMHVWQPAQVRVRGHALGWLKVNETYAADMPTRL